MQGAIYLRCPKAEAAIGAGPQLRALSSQGLKSSKDRGCTTSMGSLVH